ncbi:MjaI family restriction endonuclease [Brachyspira aalborgi]|jgi:probable type-2 restriction enzyme mthZI|uniref:MjaI family restriction endonuclease n=1 Tax=Brachyspira aalborgi TaxID=29522 RepID=A0A5C8FRF8_9SPIR|nr:MjaI family restriction endonuclease [Brachyspira aalborgi]TXJ52268.1 MjaI family restriction endonuclease [Brachyspira aalborgi]TXJ56149.1 MjaI family restriction endonuclease [Brachyspira aalborgi]
MTLTIKNEELLELNESSTPQFPKYTSQLINLANQNAQGTRPKVVGQLSELFQEYQKNTDEISIDTWEKWYLSKYPKAIEDATNRIYEQIQNLKNAITLIDRDMIQKWVEDLIITKTYNGLYIQKAIFSKIAKIKQKDFRLAKTEEEAIGIDGYIDNVPYSIKPDTYKTMSRLSESIEVKIIYYTKTKSGIEIEFD